MPMCDSERDMLVFVTLWYIFTFEFQAIEDELTSHSHLYLFDSLLNKLVM